MDGRFQFLSSFTKQGAGLPRLVGLPHDVGLPGVNTGRLDGETWTEGSYPWPRKITIGYLSDCTAEGGENWRSRSTSLKFQVSN